MNDPTRYNVSAQVLNMSIGIQNLTAVYSLFSNSSGLQMNLTSFNFNYQVLGIVDGNTTLDQDR